MKHACSPTPFTALRENIVAGTRAGDSLVKEAEYHFRLAGSEIAEAWKRIQGGRASITWATFLSQCGITRTRAYDLIHLSQGRVIKPLRKNAASTEDSPMAVGEVLSAFHKLNLPDRCRFMELRLAAAAYANQDEED